MVARTDTVDGFEKPLTARSKQIVREAVSLAHNSYFGDGEVLRQFLLRK